MKGRFGIIALLLAAALLLPACGKGAETESSPAPEELFWTAAESKAALPPGFSVYGAASFDGGFYVYGCGSGGYSLCRVGDGGEVAELSGYEPLKAPEGREGEGAILSFAVSPDGNIVTCEMLFVYIFDLPEDFDSATDSKYTYLSGDERYVYLRVLSPDGSELSSADITEVCGSDFWVNSMKCGGGNVYISSGGTVRGFTLDGKLCAKFDFNGSVTGLVTLSDGSAAVCGVPSGGENLAVRPIDPVSGELSESVTELDFPAETFFDGAGEHLFYAATGTKLYGVFANGEREEVVDLLACDLEASDLTALRVAQDGTVRAFRLGERSGEAYVLTFSQVPESELPEKTVLTLATSGAGSALRALVTDFNRSSTDCRVRIVDYGESDALSGLDADIIGGKVPDIIDVSSFDRSKYEAKGLFIDLYPYLDADGELDRESFVPGVLNAMETDGELRVIAPGFSVVTLAGNAEVVGDTPGWTFAELKEIFGAQPEGTSLLDSRTTKSGALEILLTKNLGGFVDYESGTCRFDSPEFLDILNLANACPESGDENVSEPELLASGKQLLTSAVIHDFTSFQLYDAIFDGRCVFKGYPTAEGVGNYLILNGTQLAVTTSCGDPQAAWSFVRSMLGTDYQTSDGVLTFPVTKDGFESVKKEAMRAAVHVDPATGEIVESSKGFFTMGDLTVEIYAATQEDVSGVEALIASASGLDTDYDAELYAIIAENAAALFAGDKTAEAVAEQIQSTVSIYLSERG